MNDFTTENWNFCQYINNGQKAIISFGMTPEQESNDLYYYVTVLDDLNNLLQQNEFSSLEKACQFANDKYKNVWEFKNLEIVEQKGGCGSCSAH